MNKIVVTPQLPLFPTPVVLVGANVDNKPNFMAVAWCGVVASEPPSVSVSVRPSRFTHRGIVQNQTFSVNVPSVDLMAETDYCGQVTGAKVDKARVCGFKVFYGKLKNAPLVEQFPINLECRVIKAVEAGSHTVFIAQVEEVHISEECLVDGNPDIARAHPFVYTLGQTKDYRSLGDFISKQGAPGKAFKNREPGR